MQKKEVIIIKMKRNKLRNVIVSDIKTRENLKIAIKVLNIK